MQTFLPHECFRRSAQVLDTQRLGKQRLECAQLIAVVAGSSRGWASHPAARMWAGHPDALMLYMNCVLEEWHLRGYRSSYPLQLHDPLPAMPSWLGDERLHSSHRSNLLRKRPEHYGLLGWTEGPDLPYHWPLPGEPR